MEGLLWNDICFLAVLVVTYHIIWLFSWKIPC